MSNEPYYVEDPWDEEDNTWKHTDDFDNQELINKAFSTCGRTARRFRKQSERNKWRKIDKKLSKAQITIQWYEFCLTWAQKKNRGRIIIKLPALANFILNMGAMNDWIAEHPEVGKEVIDTLGFHEGDISDR